jgi:hypothetical protein
MIVLPKICLLALLGAEASPAMASALHTPAPPLVTAVPQQSPKPVQFKSGSSSPTGGTPEPGSILLLVGGALGYGAWRLQKRKGAAETKES